MKPGSRPKVLPPHQEAAAAKHADLADVDQFADKPPKVSVVDREVVTPFSHAWTDQMRVEVRLELIRGPTLVWHGWLVIIKACGKREPTPVERPGVKSGVRVLQLPSQLTHQAPDRGPADV